MRVPFLDLVAQQAEIADEVLPIWRAQFTSAAFIGGSEVATFEREYAAYIGVRHCVGVANGTDAVELALRAVGIRPGDEVIIPVNTFIATAEAATRMGAVPVFVDVDEDFLLIDPSAVEAAITPRTRAIVPVHLYGQTAPMDALIPLAARHGLVTIDDAAQSQGASSTGGRAGRAAEAATVLGAKGKAA
ncbi:DegT/DnrJ/EryC1/StrS family aminotransferase [Glaciibacter sp. 2TAF33]|uniref:DegT/DnrJ/EryC1/StrS family aminotransferase n=1 Tax=Glaciibacter sp. 2TAF33 TaxID=3233015 RepID=UPI003F8EEAFC